jgi:hypothetical protein
MRALFCVSRVSGSPQRGGTRASNQRHQTPAPTPKNENEKKKKPKQKHRKAKEETER